MYMTREVCLKSIEVGNYIAVPRDSRWIMIDTWGAERPATRQIKSLIERGELNFDGTLPYLPRIEPAPVGANIHHNYFELTAFDANGNRLKFARPGEATADDGYAVIMHNDRRVGDDEMTPPKDDRRIVHRIVHMPSIADGRRVAYVRGVEVQRISDGTTRRRIKFGAITPAGKRSRIGRDPGLMFTDDEVNHCWESRPEVICVAHGLIAQRFKANRSDGVWDVASPVRPALWW